MNALARRRCRPCAKGARPLPAARVRAALAGLPEWKLAPGARALHAEYLMKDFAAAFALVRRVASLAEREDHHPDMHLTSYRKLRFDLSTHSIGGLSENDLILAAKISALPKKLKR